MVGRPARESGTRLGIHVDSDLCVGAGQCARVANDVFDQSDTDGVVLPLQEQPPPELLETVREAVSRCPTGAIRTTET
ncbi:ferredoxin [Streptomyces sp. NPDC099050]|uniref:ferredoxin n=1 Tax=Streptomyces sp. NPDC099050 TaxID=3366100 RepID=UPI00380B4B46